MAQEIIGGKVVIDTSDIKTLKTQLKEATGELHKMVSTFGETSVEAANAAKKVAGLKDSIGDAKNLVDQFNPDQKFRALTTIVSGAASGFTALQGAMGLFGSENEDVAKSLQKVQAAMAFSQGINQLGDLKDGLKNAVTVIQNMTVVQKANALANQLAAGTMKLFGVSVESTAISFRVLKTAIVATGIGILVIAIGELVSKISEWTSSTDDQEAAQKRLNDAVADSNLELEKQLKGIDYVNKAQKLRAEAAGKTADEIAKIDKKSAEERLQALRDNVDRLEKERNAAQKAGKIKIEDTEKINKEILEANLKVTDQIQKNELDSLSRQAEISKQSRAEAKERIIKDWEDRKKQLREEYQVELEAYANRKRIRDGLNPKGSIINLTADKAEADKAEKERLKENEADYQEFLKESNENGLGAALSLKAKETQANDEYNALKLASDKRLAADKDSLRQQELAATAGALNAVSELVGAQTVAGKALAIGASIINTYQGATKALAQGGFLGIVSAAAVIATGLSAVKRIISTPLPGASGGGSIGGAPSLSTSAPLTPTTVASNTVTLDQRSINALGNQAVRAYVVETDVTGVQNKVRRIERQTKFG